MFEFFQTFFQVDETHVFPHPLFSNREALKNFRVVVHVRCFFSHKNRKSGNVTVFPQKDTAIYQQLFLVPFIGGR